MEREHCRGLGVRRFQYDKPDWAPLEAAVGERLAGGFMWMHNERLEDGTELHAYKHIYTRDYLYLGDDGRAFEPTACKYYVPLRLDHAIERALCTWWLLSGWDQEDVEAIKAAVTAVEVKPGEL